MCDGYTALLGSLYAGIREARPFNTFLVELATAVGADAGTIVIERHRRDRLSAIFSGSAPAERRAAYDRVFEVDPFVGLPFRRAITICEHIGGDDPLSSAFMRDFMIPNGLCHVLGIDLPGPSGARMNLRATRRHGDPDFGAAEKALFEDIAPHVEQALCLFLDLDTAEAERGLYSQALNRLAFGAVLVDREGHVLRSTERAEALLGKRHLLTPGTGHRRLALSGAKRQDLTKAIADMASASARPDASRALSLTDDDGGFLNLLIRPATVTTRLDSPLHGAAIVIVSDASGQEAPSPETLTRLYELTPAEAELAAILAQGLDLSEASDLLGVSKNTVKAHLRVIFAKTHVRRQSSLVRLVLRSVDEFTPANDTAAVSAMGGIPVRKSAIPYPLGR